MLKTVLLWLSWVLGIFAGALLTPFMLPVILARRARFFHPSGESHAAQVFPPSGVLPGAPAQLAARLAGPALVRFSGGLFFRRNVPDSLGLGLRFYSQPLPSSVSSPGDQDLTLVTLRSFSPPAVLAGIRQTNIEDYLDNIYQGVFSYQVAGVGLATLRLTASGAGAPGRDRAERLLHATEEGRARLLLEIAPKGSDLYMPVAEILIGERLSDELQDAFSINPRSAGRGLRPVGFLHGLRVVPYKINQLARRHVRPQGSQPVQAPEVAPLARSAGVAR